MNSENNSELLAEMKKVSQLLALIYVRDVERKEGVLSLNNAGLAAPEIAALLGMKQDTVRKTITRAKNSG